MLESDVLKLSACAQAAAVRNGDVSSEELTSVYLSRIERYNASLAAFVATNGERALTDARAMDRRRAKTKDRAELPPFFGVPTGIKDMHLTRGFPTRMGTRGWPTTGYVIDDILSAQVRRAGFVILGKLATSEVGAMPITEPDIHPPTATPWNNQHSAGGSSGGSGSAVAAGLVPIAPGSDGAGSIRIPAAFGHLVGIKPSRGRVPNTFKLDDKQLLYTDGPIARTLGDAAALLDVLAGFTVGKPHWAPKPTGTFSEAILKKPRSLRIRMSLTHTLGPTDPEIEAAVREVAATFTRLGHEVIEAPWIDTALDDFLPLWQFAIGHAPLLNLDRVQPITRWLGEAGRKLTPAFMKQRHQELEDGILRWFGDTDVWISPAVSATAPRLGLARQPNKTPRELFAEAAAFGAFTAPFNISGQPALSLPLGLTKSGLPMGIQFGGKAFDEETILSLAGEFNREHPFEQRRPEAYFRAT